MIKVFNGNWRGIGENGKGLGLLLDFNFRNIIFHFKGANLHVFLSICLHSDQDGFCFPSYDTIERETGYKRATVSRAINELCETKIGDQYVLMRWRERDEQGRFTGSNRYRIFPTVAEILEVYPEFTFSNCGKNPTLENTNSGQSELEDKPVSKEKPVFKEKPLPTTTTTEGSGRRSRNSDSEYGIICQRYEQEIGLLSPTIADSLSDLLDEYKSHRSICDAITIAAKANKRSMRYVEGILKNMRANGKDGRQRTDNTPTVLIDDNLMAFLEEQQHG